MGDGGGERTRRRSGSARLRVRGSRERPREVHELSGKLKAVARDRGRSSLPPRSSFNFSTRSTRSDSLKGQPSLISTLSSPGTCHSPSLRRP